VKVDEENKIRKLIQFCHSFSFLLAMLFCAMLLCVLCYVCVRVFYLYVTALHPNVSLSHDSLFPASLLSLSFSVCLSMSVFNAHVKDADNDLI
jgi:hypothetical protein